MRTEVHIKNLKCGKCESTIISKLSQVKNITEVVVNNDECTVAFNYHTNHDFEAANHLLSRIGYPIVGKENKLKTNV